MTPADIPLPILGIDLMSPATDLPEGAVRIADNVDLTKRGDFRTRDGYEVAVAADDCHSIFATDRGILVGQRDQLCVFDPAVGGLFPILDVGGGSPIDFTQYNGHTYFTNRVGVWWIPSDEAAPRAVGVRMPFYPSVEAADTGALAPGEYGVAVSCTDDRGEESGVKLVGTVDLPSGGGVYLMHLPQVPGWTVNVYLTGAGGDVLYRAESFAAVFPGYLVGQPPDGSQSMTQFLVPLPAGDFIRGRNARMYVARDDVVLFSPAMRPHLHDPRSGFIKLVGKVRFIEPVEGGLYVGDDRGVWFYAGNEPENFSPRLVTPARAVRRSSLTIPGTHFNMEVVRTDKAVAVWLGEEGYVVGRPDGSVVSLHPDRVRVAADFEGRSVFTIRKGVKQVITFTAAAKPAYGLTFNSVGV